MPNTKVVGIIFPYILTPIPNLYDHSFPRCGQITCLTFRRPTTLTFDLKFWKYLSVTVYPYVICMPSFIIIGWEMAEILHFEILRKHGQTHRQTDRHGHYNTSPSPSGGEVIITICVPFIALILITSTFPNRDILVSEQGHTDKCTWVFCCWWTIAKKTDIALFDANFFSRYPFDIPYHCKMTMFINILATFTVEKLNIHNWINVMFRNRVHNSSSNRQHRVCSPSVYYCSLTKATHDAQPSGVIAQCLGSFCDVQNLAAIPRIVGYRKIILLGRTRSHDVLQLHLTIYIRHRTTFHNVVRWSSDVV